MAGIMEAHILLKDGVPMHVHVGDKIGALRKESELQKNEEHKAFWNIATVPVTMENQD